MSEQHTAVTALLRRREVEEITGLSRQTIYRMMRVNKFPNSVALGTGSVRWRLSDIIAWQAGLAEHSVGAK